MASASASDTGDVLAAARTKWNFLPFYPGLVGGHCIGVDPYYLTTMAQRTGYHSEVILAGRRINDNMARYTARRQAALLSDPGIVRNRLKVQGFVRNARAYLELRESGQTLAALVWAYQPGGRRRRPRYLGDVAASTPESDALSKALRQRGFTFVGTTICYAFMQAVGIVDDHQQGCFAARRRR